MKLRHYALLVLLIIFLITLATQAQGPIAALVNNQFITGQQLAGNNPGNARRIIGMNQSNLVSLDPDAVGATFGGAVTIPSLTLTGALTNTGGITVSNLSANLQKGSIPLDLWTARIISANAIQNTTEGGVPDGNSDPGLARVNGATDKQSRVVWAASSVVELQFPPIVMPTDFDAASVWTINILAAMAGAVDTPTVTFGVFAGIGDTTQGGATAAVTGTTIARYQRSVNGSSTNSTVKPVSIAMTPGAHTTDALYVYAAWIEYQRKN